MVTAHVCYLQALLASDPTSPGVFFVPFINIDQSNRHLVDYHIPIVGKRDF
jgi:hypothetical protein